MTLIATPGLIAFICAFVAAIVLTPIVRALAWGLGIVTQPAADRWHDRPTALLGGVAIFGGVFVGVLGVIIAGPRADSWMLSQFGRPGLGVLVAATMMFATGLIDDRMDFRPATKIVLQSIAASALISAGVILPLTGVVPFDVLVTFFWFIGITNAVNLLDNMDGVAVGVVSIAAVFLALAFARESAWALSALCLAVAGAGAGFLPFNYHRASIFMGDSGSLFLGALLAGLGAAYPRAASGNVISILAIPALVVIIPIMDTFLVTVSRTLAGRPISVGGRDHTTHRLVALGLSQRQTALLLYSFAAAAGLAGLLLPDTPVGIWIGAAFLVALAVLAAYLVRIHKYSVDEATVEVPGKLTVLVTDLLHKRRALEVILDLVLFAAAHVAAYLLRYDGVIPPTQFHVLEITLAIAVGAKLLAFLVMGVYRGTWQRVTIVDFNRLLRATALGTLFTVAAFVFIFREEEFARTIFVIDAILVLLFTAGVRFSFRSLDLFHQSQLGRFGINTLIYGAGRGGETVVRELLGDAASGIRPVGFVDDDLLMKGRLIYGLPVLGDCGDLPAIFEQKRIGKLVVAAPVSPERWATIRQAAARSSVELLRMEIRFNVVSTLVDADATVDEDAGANAQGVNR